MCTDPVYMNCNQMVDLACSDATDPDLKQSMLHCFLNIVIEELNLNKKCVEVLPTVANPIYDVYLYKIQPCPIKILNINDFKPNEPIPPCVQPPEVKQLKCPCNLNETNKLPEIDNECVCELMERVQQHECEINKLSDRLLKFILEFRRKLPRKSQLIRDTKNDCCCDALDCDCDKKCSCGADNCDCIIESSTSSDDECNDNINNTNINKNLNNNDCHISLPNLNCDENDDGTVLPKVCYKLCDPISNVACKLLTDPEFIKEILKRVSKPIVQKLLKFEDQIHLLNKEFLKFLCQANHEYTKHPSVNDCMDEINNLRKLLKDKDKELLYTLEEIQDMLDAKLDKWHIPSLKKYIKDLIEQIEMDLNEIKAKQDCPKGAATIIKNALCVCCNQPVCQLKVLNQVPILPVLHPTPLPKFMGKKGDAPSKCNQIERFCGGSHTTTQPIERLFKPSNLVDDFGKGKVLTEKIVFGKGIDGKIYRCEPPRPICTCYENLMTGKKFPCGAAKHKDVGGDSKDQKSKIDNKLKNANQSKTKP